ncbi:hypothetical protein Pst134EB_027604, partial [Puccinia striiformis f. sp. tritici]
MDITISKSALTINDISTSSISDTLCKSSLDQKQSIKSIGPFQPQSTICYRLRSLDCYINPLTVIESFRWYQSPRWFQSPRCSQSALQSISIILIDRSQSFPLIDLNHSHRSISFILIDQSQSLSSIDLFHSHQSISIIHIDRSHSFPSIDFTQNQSTNTGLKSDQSINKTI